MSEYEAIEGPRRARRWWRHVAE